MKPGSRARFKMMLHRGAVRSFLITAFVLLLPVFVMSQSFVLKGIIKDEKTLKPIPNANVRLFGTMKGTSTNSSGNFSLKVNKIPASLAFTCVGYEDVFYEIDEEPGKTVEFLLTPATYQLREVEISSVHYSFLFKDKDYSVLDYEIMGDNLLLLIFRYQLKRSELVLLNSSGDTLAISKLPELPPSSLHKDFLANVHYFSRAKNSYQCFFDDTQNLIGFYDKTTVDSLLNLTRPFIFRISGRLYFQEELANGFGTAVGFYEQGAPKKYILKYVNEKKASEYIDDQKFYAAWNTFLAGSANLPALNASRDSRFYTGDEARAGQLFYWNMIYPLIKVKDDTLAFFNFGSDIIELMDWNGKQIRTVPISFHLGTAATGRSSARINLSYASWRWGNKILVDDYYHTVYTTFQRNGKIRIRKIDLQTGSLSPGTELPFPFPEKIEVYKGDAYFLIRSDGSYDKWKLVKCNL